MFTSEIAATLLGRYGLDFSQFRKIGRRTYQFDAFHLVAVFSDQPVSVLQNRVDVCNTLWRISSILPPRSTQVESYRGYCVSLWPQADPIPDPTEAVNGLSFALKTMHNIDLDEFRLPPMDYLDDINKMIKLLTNDPSLIPSQYLGFSDQLPGIRQIHPDAVKGTQFVHTHAKLRDVMMFNDKPVLVGLDRVCRGNPKLDRAFSDLPLGPSKDDSVVSFLLLKDLYESLRSALYY